MDLESNSRSEVRDLVGSRYINIFLGKGATDIFQEVHQNVDIKR